MWYVYLLKSVKHKKSYIGSTDDLTRRLREHNLGKSIYTKRYLPWKLIYSWEFKTYKEARQKEKFYKSGYGREILKDKIEKSLKQVKNL